ncbi:MAG: cation diffusion facilitator family transporter [Promethearchaeota archaeon]
MGIESEKDKIANYIVLYSVIVLSVKIVIVILSRSLSVISEMIDAGVDIMLIFIMKRGIEKSKENPSSEHTFGKGRFETMSAIIQTIVIVVIYAIIINDAIERIIDSNTPSESGSSGFGIMVFMILTVSNLLLGLALIKKSKKLMSDAFKIQGMTYLTDSFRSVMVMIALYLTYLGMNLADPIFAIIISIIIVIATFYSSKEIFDNLLEKNPFTPEEQIKIIENTVLIKDITGIQEMRAKRVGDKIFLMLTILMDNEFKLKYCHQKTEEAEKAIKKLFPDKQLDILIHVHGY